MAALEPRQNLGDGPVGGGRRRVESTSQVSPGEDQDGRQGAVDKVPAGKTRVHLGAG